VGTKDRDGEIDHSERSRHFELLDPDHLVYGRINDMRVPVKIAQEQLGHASISTTLNIYTHVVDASHRKAIEPVECELFPSDLELPDGTKPANSSGAIICAPFRRRPPRFEKGGGLRTSPQNFGPERTCEDVSAGRQKKVSGAVTTA
jgi:hypothetical protein